MKKSLLFAVLLSFTINTTVQAQLKEEAYDLWDLLLGGRVGASASTLTKTGGDIKIWPTATVFTEVFVNPHLSMTFEASYVRKGANNVIVDESRITPEARQRYQEEGIEILLGPNNPYTYNLDYMNTTYLLKYYLNRTLTCPFRLLSTRV